ncbi:MAG: hypothetical protein ACTHV8_06730 [Nesterenkonia sp.]
MTRKTNSSAPASRKPQNKSQRKTGSPRRSSNSRGTSPTKRAPAHRASAKRAPTKRTPARTQSSRSRTAARRSLQAARYLWAAVTALVIAALLFEPTLVWTLGVGVFMVAAAEFSGFWLIVSGYGLACLPAVFGLLVATGRFWTSLTHGLWIGAVYAVVGFIFLDQILGVISPSGW